MKALPSLPLFLPPALGPPGQSGSNRRFLPRRKGCLARHKPPDKGASIAQTVPIWACPPAPDVALLSPLRQKGGNPGPAPPAAAGSPGPGASCSPAAAAASHQPDASGCCSPTHASRGAHRGAAGAPQGEGVLPGTWGLAGAGCGTTGTQTGTSCCCGSTGGLGISTPACKPPGTPGQPRPLWW